MPASITSVTRNHGQPFPEDFSPARALTGLGRLTLDGMPGPYRCDIAAAENGVMVTLQAEKGGTRACFLPLTLLKPMLEERAQLDAQVQQKLRFNAGRDYYGDSNEHFDRTADTLALCLADEGIRLPPDNRDTSRWLASSIFTVAEATRERARLTHAVPARETVRQ